MPEIPASTGKKKSKKPAKALVEIDKLEVAEMSMSEHEYPDGDEFEGDPV